MIKILTNPFSVYPEKKLVFSGLILFTASILLAPVFNAHRDGIIDLHFVSNVNVGMAFTAGLINFGILTMMLFIAGKMINPKTRLLDICITSLLSLPVFLFLYFFNITNKMSLLGSQITGLVIDNEVMELIFDNLILILVFALFGILVLVWFIILAYNGFKVATNAKGTKHTILFIVSILLAEIISKIVFYSFI